MDFVRLKRPENQSVPVFRRGWPEIFEFIAIWDTRGCRRTMAYCSIAARAVKTLQSPPLEVSFACTTQENVFHCRTGQMIVRRLRRHLSFAEFSRFA
jgi:hypothetical protein